MISTLENQHLCAAEPADTSADALAKAETRAQSLRSQCMHLLMKEDHTADELAKKLGETPFSIRPRVHELKERQLIFDSGVRRANDSGAAAIVWTVRRPTA